MPASRITSRSFGAVVLIAAVSVAFVSCNEDRETSTEPKVRTIPFQIPSPSKIELGEDGVARLKGTTEPYTGTVATFDETGTKPRYFAQYLNGKLHGPEMKFYDDGKLRREYDYNHGEKIHHREWFPNGNLKRDAAFEGGNAIGPHRTYFEDGRLRWSGFFIENLLWQGHIVDYAEDGTLMWDAIFEKGKYVSGTYPESEQEKMIAQGLVKPENALYPRKPASQTEAPTKEGVPPKP
ncbi:MAG: hypothetical protein KDL87_03590 [Verrucomicrobiae bacterium]|nr:hypothetical protein [Verrucomicrobiae bacterium]